MTVPTRAEVEAILAERIAAEPAFRDRLEADPRGVIGGLIGMTIPDSVVIELHEDSLTTIHLTIPASDHIDDSDLELVAGGVDWAGTCAACGTI